MSLKLHIAPTRPRHPKSVRQTFNTSRLRHTQTCQIFQTTLDEKFVTEYQQTDSVIKKWEQFKQKVSDTAKSTLGFKKRVHQDWFDENQEEICRALEEKRKAFIDWQNDLKSTT
jgi:hypothetical protein